MQSSQQFSWYSVIKTTTLHTHSHIHIHRYIYLVTLKRIFQGREQLVDLAISLEYSDLEEAEVRNPGLRWMGRFRSGFWGLGLELDGAGWRLVTGFRVRRRLSCQPGIGITFCGLKNAASIFLSLSSAKGVFTAFLGRFSRASPLRTLSGSYGRWDSRSWSWFQEPNL